MRKRNFYKVILATMLLLNSTGSVLAQRFDRIDKSPHDIVYCWNGENEVPQIKVVYGRPDANDFQVFGTQIPYGKIWRTGSNEATEITFYEEVLFGDQIVGVGTYVLYTIPNEDYWIVILNKNTDSFGAFFYNSEDDVVKLKVVPKGGQMVKNFSIGFYTDKDHSEMILAWAKTRIQIPFKENKS